MNTTPTQPAQHTPVEVRLYRGKMKPGKGSFFTLDDSPIVSGLCGSVSVVIGDARTATARVTMTAEAARALAERIVAECDRQATLAKLGRA